jgi:hypothetical protein
MTRKPQDTSAEELDGGNLQVRLRGGARAGHPARATQQYASREELREDRV